jgi:hypothetical protein
MQDIEVAQPSTALASTQRSKLIGQYSMQQIVGKKTQGHQPEGLPPDVRNG